MRRKTVIIFLSLTLLVVLLAGAEDSGARKAFARLRLAEVYFRNGADEEAYDQLRVIMTDCPGTDADFQARKRMVQELLADAEQGGVGEEVLNRVEEIVLGAVTADLLPVKRRATFVCELAESLRGNSMHAGAVKVARTALAELDGDEPREGESVAPIARMLYGLGVDYQCLGEHEQSASAYEAAATRYPDDMCGAHAHLRLGSYYRDKDPERAEAEFRVSLTYGENSDVRWQAHYYLADFLVKQGREEEAMSYLEALVPADKGEWSRRAQELYSGIISAGQYANAKER